jgi:hypothetical protein
LEKTNQKTKGLYNHHKHKIKQNNETAAERSTTHLWKEKRISSLGNKPASKAGF